MMPGASSINPPLPDEPGIFSVIGETLIRGAQAAVVGAVIGLIGSTIAHFFSDYSAVQSVLNTVNMQGLSGTKLFLTGAAAGGTAGFVGGAAIGCYGGISRMQHYYHDYALPREHEIGKSEGVAIGAELEHTAMEHEMQTKQYRDAILQESNVKKQMSIQPL